MFTWLKYLGTLMSNKSTPDPDKPTPMDVPNRRDFEQMLQIFPVEVWENIIGNVDDPEDLENCWNASSVFHQFIHSDRVLFLFPKVWDILEKVVYHNTDKYWSDMSIHSRYMTRRSAQHVWVRDIRKISNLRLVCQDWKSGFDKFYQKRLLHGSPNEVTYGEVFQNTFSPRQYPFTKDVLSSKFLAKFSEGEDEESYCPFMSRTITLRYDLFPRDTCQQFVDNLTTILVKYGHFLNKLTVSYQLDTLLLDSYYHNLWQQLSALKNLKALEISADRRRTSELGQAGALAEINAYPPVKLDKLYFLSISDIPSQVFNDIIRLNNHVSRLVLRNSSPRFSSYAVFSIKLQNLTNLEIWLHSPEEFGKLATAEFSPAFEKLEVVCLGYIPPQKIFSVLGNKWSSTLKCLRLDMHGATLKSEEEKLSATLEWNDYDKLREKFLPSVTKLIVNLRFSEKSGSVQY